MEETPYVVVAIRFLREATVLLLASQIILLVAQLFINLPISIIFLVTADVASLAAALIKIIPSASYLALLRRKFKVLCLLMKLGIWGSLALTGLALCLLSVAIGIGRTSYEDSLFHLLYFYLYLNSQPWAIVWYILSPELYDFSLYGKNLLGLGSALIRASNILAAIGWLSFFLKLYSISSETGIDDFKASVVLAIFGGITNIPLLTMLAYYELWVGTNKALDQIQKKRKDVTIVVEQEIERINREAEVLESKVREYLGYLMKLEHMHEKGEMTDEAYQYLKTMYTSELEKYKIELEELNKKIMKLEEERGTRVRTEVTESVYTQHSPTPEYSTVPTSYTTRVAMDRVEEPLPAVKRSPVGERTISHGIRQPLVRKDIYEREGPPYLLFILFIFLTIISIFIAVVFDPYISLIILVVSVVAVVAGYYSGSKEV